MSNDTAPIMKVMEHDESKFVYRMYTTTRPVDSTLRASGAQEEHHACS